MSILIIPTKRIISFKYAPNKAYYHDFCVFFKSPELAYNTKFPSTEHWNILKETVSNNKHIYLPFAKAAMFAETLRKRWLHLRAYFFNYLFFLPQIHG